MVNFVSYRLNLKARTTSKDDARFEKELVKEMNAWDQSIQRVISTLKSQKDRLEKIKNDLVALQKQASRSSGDITSLCNRLKNWE